MARAGRQRRTGGKTVGGAGKFIKFADMVEGDYFSGKYVKTYKDARYDNDRYEVLIDGFESDALLHNGDAPKIGDTVTFDGCGSLNYAMDEIEVGTEIELEYQGTSKLPDGHKYKNKDAHQVEVKTFGEEETPSEDDDLDL